MNISSTFKSDNTISNYVVSWFVISAINLFVKLTLPIPESLWVPISVFLGAYNILLLFKAFKYIWKCSSKMFIISFLLCLLLYLYSLLKNVNYIDPILDYALWTFIFCLPMGLGVYSIYDYKILYEKFLKFSYIIGFLLMLIILGLQGEDGQVYSMSMSVSLVVPLLFHLNEFLFKHKKINLLVAIIEFSVILLFGSRGVLLCVLAFIGCYFTLFSNTKILYKVIISSTVFLMIGVVSLYVNDIALFLLNLISQYDIKSRTLFMIVENEVGDLSGRDAIWNNCKDMIMSKPLFGYGIGGEIKNLTLLSKGNLSDGYMTTHNIFLELMLNLGVFIGILISLILVLSIFRVRKINDQYQRMLLLVFYSSIVVTFFSGDGFWVKPTVSLTIFLFLATYKNRANGNRRTI